MKNTPSVSVIMPVYNSATYLSEAIQSILNQSFCNFEFLIVCDPSTDGSIDIASSFSDSRIRIIQHVKKQGLVSSLNEGISEASGELIARMDADDISSQSRLEKQVAFLNAQPGVGVVGSGIRIINQLGEAGRTVCFPEDHELISWAMPLVCPMVHPSVMMRKQVLLDFGGYSQKALYSEDYELWDRLIACTRFANLANQLLFLRKHERNISTIMEEKHMEFAVAFSRINIQRTIGRDIDNRLVLCLISMGESSAELAGEAAELVVELFRIACAGSGRNNLHFIRRDAAMRVGVLGIRATSMQDRLRNFSLARKIYPAWPIALMQRALIRFSGFGQERLVG